MTATHPSGGVLTSLFLTAGTIAAFTLSSWALSTEPSARRTAWVLVGVEAVAALLALILLERLATREWSVDAGAQRDLRSSEAASESLQTAYSTVSNALIILGMLGAAGQLLFHSAEADSASRLTTLAPRAFAATSFGLWCGLVLALRGQYLASALRSSFLGVSSVTGRAGMGRPSGPTAEQVSQVLAVLERQNATIGALSASLVAVVARDQEFQELQKEAYSRVVIGLGGKQSRSIVAQLVETSAGVDRLGKLLKRSAEGQEKLCTVLSEESRSLLDGHARLLSIEAVRLAEVSTSSLVSAVKTSVADRLNELAGEFDASINKIYASAFDQASRRLNETLDEAVNRAGGLGMKLAEAVKQLAAAAAEVENLSASLEEGGKRAGVAQVSYEGAVQVAAEATARLAQVLSAPLPEGSGPALASSLSAVCEVLSDVLESLRSTLDEVNERKGRLARAREILTQRFSP